MRWSKLIKRVEMLFSEKVVTRVGLHSTRYNSDRDSTLGRAWITIDGVEIFNFLGDGAWHGRLLEKQFDSELFEPFIPAYDGCKNQTEFMQCFNSYLDSDAYKDYEKKRTNLESQLYDENIYHQSDLGMSICDYCNMSIGDILNSANIIIKALGMLDRRVGKRRLKSMNIEKEHTLVQKFYQLRIDCEGMNSLSMPSKAFQRTHNCTNKF